MEHGRKHQLFIGAQAGPSKSNGHWVIWGIFQVLKDVFAICCALAHHIHSIDRQHCMAHWTCGEAHTEKYSNYESVMASKEHIWQGSYTITTFWNAGYRSNNYTTGKILRKFHILRAVIVRQYNHLTKILYPCLVPDNLVNTSKVLQTALLPLQLVKCTNDTAHSVLTSDPVPLSKRHNDFFIVMLEHQI